MAKKQDKKGARMAQVSATWFCGAKLPEGGGSAATQDLHPGLREEDESGSSLPQRAWHLLLTKQGILNKNNLYKMAHTKSCGMEERDASVRD